jgi:hypothetical protein
VYCVSSPWRKLRAFLRPEYRRMTHLQAAIEANRCKLRAAQRCGDRDTAQLFAGIVVGQRIILGEVKVTLRPRILSTADEPTTATT